MTIDYFGDHVAFDVEAWHCENGSTARARNPFPGTEEGYK